MHEQPKVLRYSGEELVDLLGPVETQYCDAQLQPSSVPQGETATVIIDFRAVPNFDTVFFEVPGTPEGGSVPRSAGEEKGTEWSFSGLVDPSADTGNYTLFVSLAEGRKVYEPCSVSFSVVPGEPNGDEVR